MQDDKSHAYVCEEAEQESGKLLKNIDPNYDREMTWQEAYDFLCKVAFSSKWAP